MTGILSFGVILDTHVTIINNHMSENINKYHDIDLEYLCIISKCSKVEVLKTNKTYLMVDGHLELEKNAIDKSFIIHNNLYYINDKLAIYNKESDTFFILNIHNLLMLYLRAIIFFAPLSLLVFIFPLLRSIKEEKNNSIMMLAGNEALMANKSMIDIAENIHHELNTPLEVIDNKIEKIYGVLSSFIQEEDDVASKIKTLPEDRLARNKQLKEMVNTDFEFIRTASEQIYTVLEKMKQFKNLRYSNGNKSIKNIIEGGFQIIKLSNSNFEYQIDNELSRYFLKTKTIRNAELLSIILNHIKNSLEANANKIAIVFSGFSKNKITIRIIDNGSGIPDNAIKKIFEPNFSTKSIDGGIRGNGMFLNKETLKTVGGDVKLIDTSFRGTTIELEIPAKTKDEQSS